MSLTNTIQNALARAARATAAVAVGASVVVGSTTALSVATAPAAHADACNRYYVVTWNTAGVYDRNFNVVKLKHQGDSIEGFGHWDAYIGGEHYVDVHVGGVYDAAHPYYMRADALRRTGGC